MSARGLRFGRRDRRRRGRTVLAVMVLLAALWLAAASRVHFNASWSDGAWGYAVLPLLGRNPEIGDLVLFDPPESTGSRVPWLKAVRGVPGTAVAVRADGTVLLDGNPVGRAKTRALDGRPLEAAASGTIPPGHFHVHADHADSYDSRYAEIGLVPRGRILGRAVALPDLPWLGLEGPLAGPELADPAPVTTTVLPDPAMVLPLRKSGEASDAGDGRPEGTR